MVELYLRIMLIIPIIIVCGNLVSIRFNIKPQILTTFSTAGAFCVFALAWPLMFTVFETGTLTYTLWNWITFGDQTIAFSLVLDEVSSVLVLTVAGIITALLSFSIKTLSHNKNRYNVYYNLLLFCLMLIILSENFVVYSIGLMGSSCTAFLLLIRGDDSSEQKAAMFGAFRINLICNFLVIFGLVGIWIITKSPTLLFSEDTVNANLNEKENIFMLISMGLPLLGILIKSSLFPFSLWATRIFSNRAPILASITCLLIPIESILLLSRISYLLVKIPLLMGCLIWIAAISVFIMSLFAIAQKSLHKTFVLWVVIINGSSILACGIGSFSTALFQTFALMIAGVFLFLSISFAQKYQETTDQIEELRCFFLKKARGEAYWPAVISLVVMAGIPGFSMFFTRESILWSLANMSASMSTIPYWAMTASSLIIVFSVSKIFFMVFWPKEEEKLPNKEVEEVSWSQFVPIVLLGIFGLFVGYLNIPYMFSHGNDRMLQRLFEKAILASPQTTKSEHIELLQMIFLNLGLVIVVALAYFRYVHERAEIFFKRRVADTHLLWKWLFNFLYIEKVYAWGILAFEKTAVALFSLVDKKVLNEFLKLIELFVEKSSLAFNKIKSNRLEVQGLYIIMSILVFVAYIIFIVCDKLLVL